MNGNLDMNHDVLEQIKQLCLHLDGVTDSLKKLQVTAVEHQ